MRELTVGSRLSIFALIASLWCWVSEAQFAVAEPSIIWRVADPGRPVSAAGQYRGAFSHNGQYVGVVKQNQRVQLRSAATGELLTELHGATDGQAGPFWYDITFSSDGRVALGAFGGVEIHSASFDRLIAAFSCDTCRVVDAVAFSPDGRLLAFQELRVLPERVDGLGWAHVVDTRAGVEVAKLDAATGRAKVAFTADGESLFATVTEHVPGRRESLGLRRWRTSDWSSAETLTFESWSMGTFAIGRVGDTTLVAYANGGQLEARNLNDRRIMWTVPLVSALFVPPENRVDEVKLDRIAFAPDGKFLITYESPVAPDFYLHQAGAVVVRRASDGQPITIYDVHGVTDIDIAADSKTFLVSAGFHEPQILVARVPPIP